MFQAIPDTTAKDQGHAVRGVRAKDHGILHGELTVPMTYGIYAAGDVVFGLDQNSQAMAGMASPPPPSETT